MKKLQFFFDILNKLDENKNFKEADNLHNKVFAMNFQPKIKKPRDPFKEIIEKLNVIQNQVADIPTDGYMQDEINDSEKENDTNQAE